MRILIVGRYKTAYNDVSPFVREQAEALRQAGNIVEYFAIKGKGLKAYFMQRKALLTKIETFHPDIIHAHYGLSGLLCCLQRYVPVVVTYHGSDINNPKVLHFSRMAMRLAAKNIFVSKGILNKVTHCPNAVLLPCGIDLSDNQCTPKSVARQKMNLSIDGQYALFAGAFDNAVKNSALAKDVVELYNRQTGNSCQLIELKGYSRQEVALLMCAADVFLLTSHNEGSPQVIKEAMACGCPIVSVDVGDVAERLQGLDGCYVAQTYCTEDVADKLRQALCFNARTHGRERIIEQGLDNRQVAKRLMEIYDTVCKKEYKEKLR